MAIKKKPLGAFSYFNEQVAKTRLILIDCTSMLGQWLMVLESTIYEVNTKYD